MSKQDNAATQNQATPVTPAGRPVCSKCGGSHFLAVSIRQGVYGKIHKIKQCRFCGRRKIFVS